LPVARELSKFANDGSRGRGGRDERPCRRGASHAAREIDPLEVVPSLTVMRIWAPEFQLIAAPRRFRVGRVTTSGIAPASVAAWYGSQNFPRVWPEILALRHLAPKARSTKATQRGIHSVPIFE